jgi:Periplasmic copper-binding protein (NosD)
MKSLFLVLFATASFAAHSFGQTIINSIPYFISTPGTYLVGSNLVYPSATGDAITIVISNVTLDLGGHFLVNSGHPSSTIGVHAHNAENITIQNGVIVGFTHGVYFNYTGGTTVNSGNIVQNLRFTNNTIGITLFSATASIIRNNQFVGPGSSVASTGIDIEGGSGNLVTGNVVSGFGVCVFAEGGNYFLQNMVSNAVIGFDLSGTDKYRFNTTFNCTASFDGGTALNAENN